MAFGQQTGPSASHRQLQDLLELLQDAGHTGFREARGVMGFSQRQAGGKFTRDEAEAYLEQLRGDGSEGAGTLEPVASQPRLSTAERALRGMRAEDLAAELQRRGWVVMEPT
jgi:hypothetical protein